MKKRTPIGIIGCGAIARKAYLPSFAGSYAEEVEVAACADANPDVANACASEFGIARVLGVEELLADPAIALVVNLTIPEAHYSLNRAALLAGKHVYCEKPLALSAEEAIELGEIAKSRNLFLCAAPDTLLGAGLQTARALLEAGEIGEPRFASAWFSLSVGSERYYRRAAGPALDFGPYYVGALALLLGPFTRVSAFGGLHPVEAAGGGPAFAPATPPHAVAAFEFASGAVASLGMSSDAKLYESRFEIVGSRGRMSVPDPNHFAAGKVSLGDYGGPREIDHAYALDGKDRGAAVVDMARAAQNGGSPRITTDFAVHTTEVLAAMITSLESGQPVRVRTSFAPLRPMASKASPDPFAET